jgi:hypothetical protein
MFGSFLPGLWLVGTTKVYPGVGADIVMESITLSTQPRQRAKGVGGVNACPTGRLRVMALPKYALPKHLKIAGFVSLCG